MKKVIALSSVLALGALGMACGETAPANNANANKPANTNAANTVANAANTVSNAANTVANKPANTAANTTANTTAAKPAANAPANK